MWVVTVKEPGPIGKWDFQANFFPRKTHYKKDAEEYAKEAIRKGAVGVEVKKAEK